MGVAGSESWDGGRRVHMNAAAGKQELEDNSSEYMYTDRRFEWETTTV